MQLLLNNIVRIINEYGYKDKILEALGGENPPVATPAPQEYVEARSAYNFTYRFGCFKDDDFTKKFINGVLKGDDFNRFISAVSGNLVLRKPVLPILITGGDKYSYDHAYFCCYFFDRLGMVVCDYTTLIDAEVGEYDSVGSFVCSIEEFKKLFVPVNDIEREYEVIEYVVVEYSVNDNLKGIVYVPKTPYTSITEFVTAARQTMGISPFERGDVKYNKLSTIKVNSDEN